MTMFSTKEELLKKTNKEEADFSFKEYTIEEFNEVFKTDLENKMDLDDFTDTLEINECAYLYASYTPEDVLNEYKEFLAEVGHKCDLVNIEGRFVALL